MAKQTGAGDLRERVTFAKESDGSDGGGGAVDGFADQFTVWAEYTWLRGGEQVLAARLSGVNTVVIRVRASSQSRQITADWQARDARTGQRFNIRSVVATTDRQWVDVTAQSGVAA